MAHASVGRVVHYVMNTGQHRGDHRPAEIVAVWGPECVNLVVTLDGSNDHGNHEGAEPLHVWRTSVKHDPTGTELGTYHWPENVAPVVTPAVEAAS